MSRPALQPAFVWACLCATFSSKVGNISYSIPCNCEHATVDMSPLEGLSLPDTCCTCTDSVSCQLGFSITAVNRAKFRFRKRDSFVSDMEFSIFSSNAVSTLVFEDYHMYSTWQCARALCLFSPESEVDLTQIPSVDTFQDTRGMEGFIGILTSV